MSSILLPRTKLAVLVVVFVAVFAFSDAAIASDPAVRFEHAQKQMRDGNLENALADLGDLREQYPWDVDYSLARAQVLERMGRDDEALLELDTATRLAPEYEDVWRLRYAIISRQAGAEDEAHRETERRDMAERFPAASWWRLPDDPARWTVLLGTGYDSLSNGLPSWNDQFIEVSREQSDRNRYGLRLARNQRYAEADYALGLNANHTSPNGWFAGGGLSLANNALFQPDLAYNAYAGMPFATGWVFTAAYGRREFPDTTVSSVVGTLEKYHGDFRFAYGLTHSHLHSASGFMGHTLTANWYLNDRSSFGLTLSTGQEAESLGNGQVLESDVSGISLSGRYAISSRYGLQWWLGTHEQGDFYRRQFLGMAISIQL